MTLQQLEAKVKILEQRLCCGKPLFKDTFDDFPDVGKVNTLYLDEETGNIYIWNGVEYVTPDGIQEITYVDLINKLNTSALLPGAKYLISDYQTTHYFLDGNVTILSAVNVAPIEPIIVTATSVNTLDSVAYSTIYPQDILHYDWNPVNWVNDRSFSNVDTVGYGLGTIITGFKGVISYREDTKQKNTAHYDFRGVKYRRWKLDAPAWDSGTTYSKNDTVTVGTSIFKSKANSNTNNATGTNDWWSPIIDLSLSSYWAWNSTNVLGVEVDDTDFIDVNTFAQQYESQFYNNYIGPKHKYQGTSIATILPNIVFLLGPTAGSPSIYQVFNNYFGGGSIFGNSTIGNNFQNNTIEYNFNGNIIANYFQLNVIGQVFSNNTINSFFSYNTIGNNFNNNATPSTVSRNIIGNHMNYNILGNSFSHNRVSSNFGNNVFGNTVVSNEFGPSFTNNIAGSSFNDNIIGNNSGNNVIGNSFYGNTIGVYFNNNVIGDYFYSNNIGSYVKWLLTPDKGVGTGFRRNVIQNEISGTSLAVPLDFTTATHVFSDYNKEIFRRLDTTVRLRYTDNLDAIIVVSPTA